jgi:hypothetical protein
MSGSNRTFKFNKRSQLVVGVHNETLSVVAMCVNNPDVRPWVSIAETQPQLQPDLVRLSAMIRVGLFQIFGFRRGQFDFFKNRIDA